jgi:glycerol kinase
MTAFTTVGHLVAAIMQGLAAQITEMGRYMAHDLDRPLSKLRVNGTLARCRTLMQAIADLMQIEVEVSPADHAALLGASALARLATDPTLSLDDAVVTGKPEWIHTPHWSSDHAADFLGRWSVAARSA